MTRVFLIFSIVAPEATFISKLRNERYYIASVMDVVLIVCSLFLLT